MLGERPFERLHLAEELSAYASRVDNPEDLSGFALLSHQALELGPQTQQWTYVRKDASQLKVSLTLSAMRGQDGVLVGFLIVAADITESLKQQQALISAKDQLMAAAEVAGIGGWEYLPGPERLHWNERMFEIFGQPLDEPPHSMPAWFDSVHPDERAAIKGALREPWRAPVNLLGCIGLSPQRAASATCSLALISSGTWRARCLRSRELAATSPANRVGKPPAASQRTGRCGKPGQTNSWPI